MTMAPYVPPPVPHNLNPDVRRFLEEEIAALALRINELVEKAGLIELGDEWYGVSLTGDADDFGFYTKSVGEIGIFSKTVGSNPPVPSDLWGGSFSFYDNDINFNLLGWFGFVQQGPNAVLQFGNGVYGSTMSFSVTDSVGLGRLNLTLDPESDGPTDAHFEISDDTALRISDPGGTRWVDFHHDTVDLNLTGVNTGDINITGVTEINLGADTLAKSDGTTGGAASAGAGNQYVELDINGTVYKVLHDGVI